MSADGFCSMEMSRAHTPVTACVAASNCSSGKPRWADGRTHIRDRFGCVYCRSPQANCSALGCLQGQWMPWDADRAVIHIVAASWLADDGHKPPVDVTEKARSECEHKPSCTLVADAGWLGDPFPGHSKSLQVVVLREIRRQSERVGPARQVRRIWTASARLPELAWPSGLAVPGCRYAHEFRSALDHPVPSAAVLCVALGQSHLDIGRDISGSGFKSAIIARMSAPPSRFAAARRAGRRVRSIGREPAIHCLPTTRDFGP
jgi:hypothetical protein